MHSKVMSRRYDNYFTADDNQQSNADRKYFKNRTNRPSSGANFGMRNFFGTHTKRYFSNTSGTSSRASNHSNIRVKSQPPVACYPVNMSVDGTDETIATNTNSNEIGSNIPRSTFGHQKNQLNTRGVGGKQSTGSSSQKKFTTPVVYNRFNYNRPSAVFTGVTTSTVSQPKQTDQISKVVPSSATNNKFKTEQCHFDESDFPSIDGGTAISEKKVEPVSSTLNHQYNYPKLSSITQSDPTSRDSDPTPTLEPISTRSNFCDTPNSDIANDCCPDRPKLFPFPSSVQDIYIHMYNYYKSYEKAMLETIATQNKITISSNDNHKVFSNEEIKKYLYMLFTQSFGSFIQCMNSNNAYLSENEKEKTRKYSEASIQTDVIFSPPTEVATGLSDVNTEMDLPMNATPQKSSPPNTDDKDLSSVNIGAKNIDNRHKKRRPKASESIYKPPHMRDPLLVENSPPLVGPDDTSNIGNGCIVGPENKTTVTVTTKKPKKVRGQTGNPESTSTSPKNSFSSLVLSSTGTVKITLNNQNVSRRPSVKRS